MKRLIASLVFLLLVGCVQVPAGRIQFGGAKAYLPKDWKADHVLIKLQAGTNQMTFEAVKIDTHNNVDVINASSAQLETVINSTANAVGAAAAAAAKAAVKP